MSKLLKAIVFGKELKNRSRLPQLLGRADDFESISSHSSIHEVEGRLVAEKIDLVFVSSDMPKGEAAELVEKLKIYPGTVESPRILVFQSGEESKDAVANYMAVGFHGFLCEPITPESILDITALARGVSMQDSQTRLRAVAGLLLTDLVDEADERQGTKNELEHKDLWEQVQYSSKKYQEVTGESLTHAVVNPMKENTPSERMQSYSGVSHRVKKLFQKRMRQKLNRFKKMMSDS